MNRGIFEQRYREREFFIDNLLVRIHFIIMMIRWTGLAPWKFEFFFQAASVFSNLLVEVFSRRTRPVEYKV